MTRHTSSEAFSPKQDPKQTVLPASTRAYGTSSAVRPSPGQDTPAAHFLFEASRDDEDIAGPSEDERGSTLVSSSSAVLPTVVESRGSAYEEGSSPTLFGETEEKADEAVLGPPWEDENMRSTRASSVSKIRPKARHFPELPTAQSEDASSNARFRSNVTLDTSNRGRFSSEGQVPRHTSPIAVGKEHKVLGRFRANSYGSSDGQGQKSVLRYFRRPGHNFSFRGQYLFHEPRHDDHPHAPVKLAPRGKLTEEDEAILSDSEADYDAFDSPSERAAQRLLSPNFRPVRFYATFMLFALLVFVFYMPFRVGFFSESRGAWSVIDVIWNAIFALDIVIHLNTGFLDSQTGTVVYDRSKIFKRYLRGWLWVDLLAAFPFTFLPGFGPTDVKGNHEIAYFLSLPKIFRLYGLMTIAQENHRLHEGAFLAVRTLLSVVVTAHLFGCGWYILATLMHEECEVLYNAESTDDDFISANGIVYSVEDYIASECPWIYRNDYANFPIGRRYLSSVYWSLTTLTTVGYGDLSARTVDEQIYSMCVQIVGVAWYGYIVGTWTTVLNSFDGDDQEQRSKMREVVAFTKAAYLPPDIAKKVRQHFRFALGRKVNWYSFNESEILGDMPSALRAEVVNTIQRHTIQQVPWFRNKDPSFIADVVMQLKPRLFKMGDILFREGTKPEELFFITSGKIMLKHKGIRVEQLKHGQVAGALGFAGRENHKLTAMVAFKEAHCLAVSAKNLSELNAKYPTEFQELLQDAGSLARRVAANSSAARADFMKNASLASLIAGTLLQSVGLRAAPLDRTPTHAPFGTMTYSENWTNTSTGTESIHERKMLPPGWRANAGPTPQTPSTRIESADGAEGLFADTSVDNDDPDGSGPPSNKSPPATNASALASDGTHKLADGQSRTANLEEAVEREVSRRMGGFEDRLSVIMEQLEGVLGASGHRPRAVSSEKSEGGDTATAGQEG